MGMFSDEDYFTEDSFDEKEMARLEWQKRLLLNQIPVKGVLNGVRKDIFSTETISLEEGKKLEDELREEYITHISGDSSDKCDLFDWYLYELQSWLGPYGYLIKRKDYATAEVVKYVSSLSKEQESEGCCDPDPSMKVIATLDTQHLDDARYYLVCKTQPIDEKILRMEKNFAEVREYIFEWDEQT